jgi:hypothetical protein
VRISGPDVAAVVRRQPSAYMPLVRHPAAEEELHMPTPVIDPVTYPRRWKM